MVSFRVDAMSCDAMPQPVADCCTEGCGARRGPAETSTGGREGRGRGDRTSESERDRHRRQKGRERPRDRERQTEGECMCGRGNIFLPLRAESRLPARSRRLRADAVFTNVTAALPDASDSSPLDAPRTAEGREPSRGTDATDGNCREHICSVYNTNTNTLRCSLAVPNFVVQDRY